MSPAGLSKHLLRKYEINIRNFLITGKGKDSYEVSYNYLHGNTEIQRIFTQTGLILLEMDTTGVMHT